MNREPIEFAMTRLAELEKVEAFARNFSLSYWGNKTDTHPLDAEEQLDCGFSGCFMGWAIHQQWFAPFGLVLGFATLDAWSGLQGRPDSYKLHIVPFVDKSSRSEFYGLALHDRHQQTDSAIRAVARLFDIEEITLGNIIYEEAYPAEDVTMALVRERLGELLELGEDTFNDRVSDRMERWHEEQRENAG